MNKFLIAIVIAMLAIFGIMMGTRNSGDSPLGWGGGGDNAYVTSVTQATTSISTCMLSIYHPTSTDDTARTCATTTYSGTPTEIPNIMNNVGFEYCIDTNNTGHAIRFWLSNSTGVDTKRSVGVSSSGFLLKAGECWNSREYGIIWGGTVYALATTTTSTVQYSIFK